MERKFISMAIVLFLVAFSIGCNNERNYQSKNVQEAVTKLEDEGKYPKLDRTENLLGEDKNKNGVRDDIDTYINSLPDTPEQKGALRQFSAACSFSLTVDAKDDNAVAK